MDKTIKLYEVGLENLTEKDVYSICIKGIRKPSRSQAAEFLAKDMAKLGYTKVSDVNEISREEAELFFDMGNEADWPIFGVA